MPGRWRWPIVATLLVVSCSDDESGLRATIDGDGRAGLPSTIEWTVDLSSQARVVGTGGSVIVLEDAGLGSQLWGLAPDNGDEVWELAGSESEFDRGTRVFLAADWMGFREERSIQPNNQSLAVYSLGNRDRLWSAPLERTDPDPLVVGAEVVVATRDSEATGLDGQLRVLALDSGFQRWTVPLTLAPESVAQSNGSANGIPFLTFHGGDTLLVRTDDASHLTAFDLDDGSVRFTFDAVADITTIGAVNRDSTNADDLILVAAGSDDEQGGTVTALDPRTGEMVWQIATELRAPSVLWVTDDLVLFDNFLGGVSGFDLASGAAPWDRSHIFLGRVVGVTDSFAVMESLGVIDLTTGEPLWFEQLGPRAHKVVVVDDTAIVQRDNDTVGVDLNTGEQRWVAPSTGEWILYEDVGAFVIVGYNVAEARDIATGAVLWQFTLSDLPDVTALADGDRLFLVSSDDQDNRSKVIALASP